MPLSREPQEQMRNKIVDMYQSTIARKGYKAISKGAFTPDANDANKSDWISRLCIDLTCKSFARFVSFASGVNAPLGFETPENHGQSYYPQMVKTWNNGEPSQEWPAYQNYSKSATTTHPGGHKRSQNNI